MKQVAILLAGGSGTRMGPSVTDKILMEIHGKPLFAHLLKAFVASDTQDALVVVARDEAQRDQLSRIVDQEQISLPVRYTLGGKERQDSVRAGLKLLPAETEWVMVHDCARGAISATAIQAVRKTLLDRQCAVSLAHRVTDTIRQFEEAPLDRPATGQLLPRDQLWAMETPQAFPRKLLDSAHARLRTGVTDDLAAVEALGERVALVESMLPNPKLTHRSDLSLFEILLAKATMKQATPNAIRIGYGYDIHRLQKGLPLVLGGIRIPSASGLLGHSDADVLSHAIADAILGACGLPDIGHFFPNTDPAIKGISSQEILKKAKEEATAMGYGIVNVDSSLIAEQPKIAPFIAKMKSRLSKTLGLPVGAIGIKATTQEQIGALGQGAGIAAHAVVSLQAPGK